MRNGKLRLLKAAICALGAAWALAGTTGAQAGQPSAMPLGAPAPAPPGFLAFCARTPDQCGLGAQDAQGRPLPPDTLGRRLYARYYWSVAFGAGSSALALATVNSHASSGGALYNWSAVFGTSRAAAAPLARASAISSSRKTAEIGAKGWQDARWALSKMFAVRAEPPLATPAAWTAPAPISASLAAALGLRFRAAQTQADGRYALASLTFAYGDGVRSTAAAPSTPPADWTSPTASLQVDVPRVRLAEAGPKTDARRAAKVAERSRSSAAKPNGVLMANAVIPSPTLASDELEAPSGPVAPLSADHTLLAQLDRVNRQVNAAIRYVPDATLYGDEDYWHLSLYPGGPAAGDCKDYVLEKERALIAAGVPAADLSIAIVQTRRREVHAVLLVDTDRGELVMDSLSAWVQPWRKTGYRWIERQAPGRRLSWVVIG